MATYRNFKSLVEPRHVPATKYQGQATAVQKATGVFFLVILMGALFALAAGYLTLYNLLSEVFS